MSALGWTSAERIGMPALCQESVPRVDIDLKAKSLRARRKEAVVMSYELRTMTGAHRSSRNAATILIDGCWSIQTTSRC
jgi:hypothetical protein